MGLLSESLPLIVLGVLSAAAWVLWYPAEWRRKIRSMTRKSLSEGSNAGALGARELESTESGLVERSAHSEQKTGWPAIEKVVSTDEYTFVYTSAVSAVVIPRSAVIEGDYEAYVDAVRKRIDTTHEASQSV